MEQLVFTLAIFTSIWMVIMFVITLLAAYHLTPTLEGYLESCEWVTETRAGMKRAGVVGMVMRFSIASSMITGSKFNFDQGYVTEETLQKIPDRLKRHVKWVWRGIYLEIGAMMVTYLLIKLT